jgi:hypothetical protein
VAECVPSPEFAIPGVIHVIPVQNPEDEETVEQYG